jgi:hypothetical protein
MLPQAIGAAGVVGDAFSQGLSNRFDRNVRHKSASAAVPVVSKLLAIDGRTTPAAPAPARPPPPSGGEYAILPILTLLCRPISAANEVPDETLFMFELH